MSKGPIDLLDKDTGDTSCMVPIVNLLSLPFTALYRAFALAKLWAWFAVPFLGAPALGMAPVYGLALTVGLFAAGYHRFTGVQDPWWWMLALSITHTTYYLVMGFIVQGFL